MTRQVQKQAVKANAGRLGGEQTRKIWSALKARSLERNENSAAALAYATASARAHQTDPYPSNKESTSTVSVEREKGLGNGAVVATSAEFKAIMERKSRR
jgi:hypothetical protein